MKKNRKKIIISIFSIFFIFYVGRFILATSSLLPLLWDVFFNKEIKLEKTNHNVNILLLGIGGENHDGPNLTDTIMFASLDTENNKVTLITIPRDLWIPDLEAKINTAYSTGESKRKDGGLLLSRAVVAKVLDLSVDYVLRIDFKGFEKAVDLVGGLDIDVERTFDDYEYPIEGKETDTCGHTEEEVEELATSSAQLEAFPCRYIHLHFNKGLQNMDGKIALQFVRSRHAKGREGSDFARSKRQEKIVKAFKDKIISLDIFINPGKIINLYDVIKKSIHTDIKDNEFDDFIKLSQQFKGAEIKTLVLDTGDEKEERNGLLFTPEDFTDFQGQWVVIPKLGNGNFADIQKEVRCFVKNKDCVIKEVKSN
ncbi:LCP family protein [Patescibacteria group bacterium]|nr:LCP family protein [Patescibacteria group bacterium]